MTDAHSSVVQTALLIRRTEERLLQLFSQDQIRGTLHVCLGQEFSAAAVAASLRPSDFVFSNHRGHGHYLAATGDVEGLIAEMMGRETGCSGGWGGSQHLHRDSFFSSGILGGLTPIAIGTAFAQKHEDSGAITVIFLGDGALGEGVIYESFNFASKWALPILFVIENNGIAQSTPTELTTAGSIEARAKAFDLDYQQGDIWNWRELTNLSERVVTAIRQTRKPCLLEVKAARLGPHSKGEETRSPEEVAALRERDPLEKIFRNADLEWRKWDAEIESRLERSVHLAQTANPPSRRGSPEKAQALPEWAPLEIAAEPIGRQINRALQKQMFENKDVLFIGEDVLSPYGGAFKIANGLSDEFPDRVISGPISEALLCGLATGLAVTGKRPILEFMFGDFLFLAFDQIFNHLTKFEALFARGRMNVILRAPVGGGRGYGPTHSQNPVSHFLGVPHLRVLSLNAFSIIPDLFSSLLQMDCGPTLLLEPKALYGKAPLMPPAGFSLLSTKLTFPDVWIRPESVSVDVTILCHGEVSEYMLDVCETLFEDHDLVAQVLCVTQIHPFDLSSRMEIIRRAARLLIVEDSAGFSSFGSEVIAQLSESSFRPCPIVRRLHADAEVIPASPILESQMRVTKEKIVAACLQIQTVH